MESIINITKKSPCTDIFLKVKQGHRITEEEALTLFHSDDVIELGILANQIKEKYNQNKVYYILNGHINYTNICINSCVFCSFRKKKEDQYAYEMSLEDIKNKFNEFNQNNIQEIHVVGALHPELPFSYYTDLLKIIKSINANITIKAFTAVEIEYFSRLYSMPLENILLQLKESGLGALPGGGAEILNDQVRKKICPDKITADTWLNVHETAHKLGLKTNATMLFGHVETYEDRIVHLKKLRDLQDKTNGFLSFIPLTYHPMNNPLSPNRTTGIDELKTIAISRIFLDNFPHIKAYWIMLGMKQAQLALNFGADDLDGTVLEEKITHAAGAKSPEMISRKELIALINECQKIPVERDSFYNGL